MERIKVFWKRYWLIILIILLAVLKQWMVCELPIYARDWNGADQWKLLKKAEDILSGEYWEVYNIDTMFKRDIIFSFFLALCHILNISYLAGFTLFCTLSCMLATYSFTYYCKNKIVLLVAYAFLLFSPVTYNGITQFVYNMTLIAPLTICSISCLMLAYNKRENISKFLFWSVGGGIFITLFWLNREDTQWIVILVFTYSMIAMGVSVAKERNIKQRIKCCIISLIPLIMLLLGNTGLCALNYAHYGIWATNDHIATGFADAYDSILKIEPESYPESCSITHNMLERAAKVSPSFAEAYGFIEKLYQENTGMVLVGRAPDDGEMEDGWTPFVLRGAAQSIGYYNDNAVETDLYWKQVSKEIEDGFRTGVLKERNISIWGSVFKHPWVKGQDYFGKWMRKWGELLWADVKHYIGYHSDADVTYSVIEQSYIQRYEAMTYNNAIEEPKMTLQVSGWVALENDSEFNLVLENADGIILKEIDANSNGKEKKFVVDYVYSSGTKLYLGIFRDGEEYQRIDLNEENNQPVKGVQYGYDEYSNIQTYVDPAEADAYKKVNRAQNVAGIYKSCYGLFLGITVITYLTVLVWIALQWKKKIRIHKEISSAWIYLTAILGSIMAYSGGLAYVGAFLFDTNWYSIPIMGLMDYLCSVSIVVGCSMIKTFRQEYTSNHYTIE